MEAPKKRARTVTGRPKALTEAEKRAKEEARKKQLEEREEAREKARKLRNAMGSKYLMMTDADDLMPLVEELAVNRDVEDEAELSPEEFLKQESREWKIRQLQVGLSIFSTIVQLYAHKVHGEPLFLFEGDEDVIGGEPMDPSYRPKLKMSRTRFHV